MIYYTLANSVWNQAGFNMIHICPVAENGFIVKGKYPPLFKTEEEALSYAKKLKGKYKVVTLQIYDPEIDQ